MTKRYILTGTPGSGKTSIINFLKREGYLIIDEAATDVIAKEQKLGNPAPWVEHGFIDKIINLQKERQLSAPFLGEKLEFYDRSPICTHALATYLKCPISDVLRDEIERVRKNIFRKF